MKHKRLRDKIANDVIDKAEYMGCCPNVLDTIVSVIKQDGKITEIHCNTDCTFKDCKSYNCITR